MDLGKKTDGITHFKSARIAGAECGAGDMAQINSYALSPLSPEDVFVFRVIMASNQVDRDFEVFPRSTLVKLANLFVGKTVVKDHERKSDYQIARIYGTELVENDLSHTTKTGEVLTELIAKCYMVKTSANADLIAEIKAGIRKEVSLGCRVDKAICSICGTDNVKTYCDHFPGRRYGSNQLCYFSLENASDAYELSFVAVPAQPCAGTVKSYGATPSETSEEASVVKAAKENREAKEMLKQLHEIAQQLLVFQKSLVAQKEVDHSAPLSATTQVPDQVQQELQEEVPAQEQDSEKRLMVNRDVADECQADLHSAKEGDLETSLPEGASNDESRQADSTAAEDEAREKAQEESKVKTAQARLRALELALSLRKKN